MYSNDVLKIKVISYLENNIGNMGKNSNLPEDVKNAYFQWFWNIAKEWNLAKKDGYNSVNPLKKLNFEQAMKYASSSIAGSFNIDYYNAAKEISHENNFTQHF